MPINRSIRELPMRPGILEARISGKSFTRNKINEIVNKMMNRYPQKRFQVILPYESWKQVIGSIMVCQYHYSHYLTIMMIHKCQMVEIQKHMKNLLYIYPTLYHQLEDVQ